MSAKVTKEKQRQRAPSKRSLQTRSRIFDAAERVFALRGFEGATLRDIAQAAEVPVALVNHHGGPKEALFAHVVARRAETLSDRRRAALDARRTEGPLDTEAVMRAFLEPYLDMIRAGDPQWLAYARLVAMVSADPRWRDLAAECFDPTARLFITELALLHPRADPQRVATGFVYSVAAMLAQITSRWRIGALTGTGTDTGDDSEALATFCAAGLSSLLR